VDGGLGQLRSWRLLRGRGVLCSQQHASLTVEAHQVAITLKTESLCACGTCWEPLKTAGQPCDEHLAPQRRLGSLGRPTQRPLKHSHLKKHTAVVRATAGKVLASRCGPPGTEHPPRAILAAHEVKHLDHLVSRSSYRSKLLLQLPKRVPAPSFSTGLALSSMDSLRRQGTQGTR
jgi:hypothetical protein